MADPEKILVAGDWHGNTGWTLHVLDQLPELLPDEEMRVIVQLGDFGFWPGETGRVYLETVDLALQATRAHLLVVPGNHEDYDQIESFREPGYPETAAFMPMTGSRRLERIHILPRGHRWTWHGRIWLACGGAASPDRAWREAQMAQVKNPSPCWWPGEIIGEADVKRCADGGLADVLVSHDRPAMAPISLPPWPREWTHQDYARCEHSRDQIQRICTAVRPRWVMHGHYHEPFSHMACRLGYEPQTWVSQLNCDTRSDNYRVLDVRSMEWATDDRTSKR